MCLECYYHVDSWYEEYQEEQNRNDSAAESLKEIINVLSDDMTYVGQDGKYRYIHEDLNKILEILTSD